MQVPNLRHNNHREYTESLMAVTGTEKPARMLVPAMRRIQQDLAIRDAPAYTDYRDWDAYYYFTFHTDLQAPIVRHIEDEEVDNSSQTAAVEGQLGIVAMLAEAAGLPADRINQLRTPRRGGRQMAAIRDERVEMRRKVRKLVTQAEEWLYGTIATTTAGNAECAEFYLRVEPGRGLKLFAITMQMIIRVRRRSEKFYKVEFAVATTKHKTLKAFTETFTKAVARYNFFPKAGTRIDGYAAVEKYLDGIEGIGYGGLRVHVESKVGNADNLNLVMSETKMMAQRLGIVWEQKGGPTAYGIREEGANGVVGGGQGRQLQQQPSERVLRCYKCGSKDHLADACPHPLCKCFKCGKYEGHKANECPYTEEEIKAGRKAQREAAALKAVQDKENASGKSGNGKGWGNRLPATGNQDVGAGK